VGRHYDSRFKGKGDFGYGWRLTAKQGSIQNNSKPVIGDLRVRRRGACEAAGFVARG
jgi:hypothetical protein